jgi:hypothetical protein
MVVDSAAEAVAYAAAFMVCKSERPPPPMPIEAAVAADHAPPVPRCAPGNVATIVPFTAIVVSDP